MERPGAHPHKTFDGMYLVVLDGRERLATLSQDPGNAVYGEDTVKIAGREYRVWDPYRSKLHDRKSRKRYCGGDGKSLLRRVRSAIIQRPGQQCKQEPEKHDSYFRRRQVSSEIQEHSPRCRYCLR